MKSMPLPASYPAGVVRSRSGRTITGNPLLRAVPHSCERYWFPLSEPISDFRLGPDRKADRQDAKNAKNEQM